MSSAATFVSTLTQEITAALARDDVESASDSRIRLLVVGQADLAMVCRALAAAVLSDERLQIADIVLVASQSSVQSLGGLDSGGFRISPISNDELEAAQGCLCCSMRSEIATVLSQLFLKVLRREQPLVRLVVVVTAAGQADPLRQALRHAPFLGQRYRFVAALGA